jgi:cytochrome c-type biogenesis protein CcmH/NrfG
MSRTDALRALLADEPNDAFARYALAMELRQEGRAEEAMAEFRTLIATSPDYTPAYLMAGQCAQDLGLTDEAKAIYRQGVEACGRAGEAHARQRCAEALADLD